jgi:polyhydroxybutyrate depolymerase
VPTDAFPSDSPRSAQVSISVGAVPRWAAVWLPPVPSGAPVVLDLHGSGFDPHRHVSVSGTDCWASAGVVVIAPCAALPFTFEPSTPPGWAWAVPGSPLPGNEDMGKDMRDDHHHVDDLAFLHELLGYVRRRWHTDTAREYALGYSGGARLLSHWVSDGRNALAAACCVSGVRTPPGHTATRLLAIHGDADDVNPFWGGDGRRWRESVPAAVRAWALTLGCTDSTTATAAESRITRWTQPDGRCLATLLAVEDAGHGWPGAHDAEQTRLFGASAGLPATAMAAQFFGIGIE